MVLLLVIIAAVAGCLLLIVSYNIKQDNHKDDSMFLVGLLFLILGMFTTGFEYGQKKIQHTTKKIEPTMVIQCKANKCDTVYIYEFNEKK
jgi:hypothetical protein